MTIDGVSPHDHVHLGSHDFLLLLRIMLLLRLVLPLLLLRTLTSIPQAVKPQASVIYLPPQEAFEAEVLLLLLSQNFFH